VKRINLLLSAALMTAIVTGCSLDPEPTQPDKKASHNQLDIWPTIQSEVTLDKQIEDQVEALLATLTIEQKVAQMIQPEIRDITPQDMRQYGFGSYLNGGGAFPNNNKHATPADWISLAESMYLASIDDSLDGVSIPTMWGTDAVHGHNNVIGATLFPHNIGLGAMNNPELMEKIAQITATEVLVTGIDWVFAPTVATVRDDRWGRAYEGYSEDPEIVKAYAAAVVKGLQGRANENLLGDDRVISTVKHFLGDGGTVKGDDQGDNLSPEAELYRIHAQGYVGGLTAGAQSVMASFNSWQGKKIHGEKYLLTEVLKNKMGFDGFVVGDWNGHGQIEGCTNENCPQAVNAGLDIFMVPTEAWNPLMENTIQQVKQGIIPVSRIEDAVRRVLRVKFRAGLFDKPSPSKRPLAGKTELLGHKDHRKIARQAVRESLVLLKNKGNILPLSPNQSILVAGDGAHNMGKQSGGWTITWQGTGNTNADFPGGTSIYEGIAKQVARAGGKATLSVDGSYQEKPDVAIVVFGEEPYAEGHGDRDNLDFERGDKKSLALLQEFKKQNIPVVALFITGRPMWVNAELNASNAFVSVWLPGSEGDGVADVILRDRNDQVQNDFKGKLSFSWPNSANQTTVNKGDNDYSPLLPYGFGLTYEDENLLADSLNEAIDPIDGKTRTREIFSGAIQKPWQLWLYSGETQLEVNSNVHKFASLSYKTVDKEVQEDAFKISLDGNLPAGVKIMSHGGFREDLSAVLESDYALRFSVKLDAALSTDVLVSMYCEASESCGHKQNITEWLKSLSPAEWHTFSISLSCYRLGGMNFNHTTVPFELSASGPLNLSLADIALVEDNQGSATVRCD
jgi:beta-glucosidase